ncbi:MAG: HAMP domain-containing histidine kinase [Alphaproteobacteria bacterium]|nr:HAMP domain-containing histidine kinase [Alphaproteobacteria bacterium]
MASDAISRLERSRAGQALGEVLDRGTVSVLVIDRALRVTEKAGKAVHHVPIGAGLTDVLPILFGYEEVLEALADGEGEPQTIFHVEFVDWEGPNLVFNLEMLPCGPGFVSVVLLECSEIVRLHREVVQQRNELAIAQQAMARAGRELAAAKERAEEANAAKSLFLANISHELRTPLNAILGFSDIMSNRLFGPLPARYEEYVRDIWRSGSHLLALINDLLDLSKIEAGKMEMAEEMLDLAEVIGECVAVASKAANEQVSVVVDADPATRRIRADRRAMTQMLLNLLSNALKFTPPGGKVSVVARRAKDKALIEVSDTGVGMDDAVQRRLFEPFRRAGSGEARRSEGTGLGLAITRRLVELHGGTISVASKPGQGTTMTLAFPATRIAD